MTDRPILFSGPMVRALLDGRKTQTRRVHFTQDPQFRRTCDEGCDSRLAGMCLLPKATCGRRRVTDARFAVGDRLWVREAWRCNGWATDLATIFYRASEGDGYSAMCEQIPVADRKPMRVTGTWRPGIHMPRWASRLTLAVSEVRVERLQDISEADAIAEGCGQYASSTRLHRDRPFDASLIGSYREGFSELWEGLNAKRGFGWDANPWVVALTFTAHRQNIDAPSAKEAA